jgi:hypothetical protein
MGSILDLFRMCRVLRTLALGIGFCFVVAPSASAKVTRVNGLGKSVSKPALTYLRIRDEIRAVVVAGCGDDVDPDGFDQSKPNGAGRCVLVLSAETGEVIRQFTNGPDIKDGDTLAYPMIGGVAVYPNSGTLPSDRGYIGDAAGQLWRIDFRDADPNNWSLAVAWPPKNAVEADLYRVGRAIERAPALSLGRDGSLTVVFGTTDRGTAPDSTSAMMVSFSDDVVLGDGDTVEFKTRRNWVMELRSDESLRGRTTVRNRTAFFTTLERAADENQCVGSLARLYAVDYTRSQERYNTIDGRSLNVTPRLPPIKTEGGNIVTDGIAFVLPVGVTVDGLAFVRSPSCAEEQEPTTEVVLNYASTSQGNIAGDIEIERQTGDRVDQPVERDLVRKGGQDVAIAVSMNGDLDVPQNRGSAGLAPFPRRVLYWGSSLTD